jgi:hypothetical protein
MKAIFKLILAALSCFAVESFVKPMFLTRTVLTKVPMAKHNFLDFARKSSVSDKYFIIQSILNHVILSRSDLLLHYCYQNLNYTDVLHINLSADLERIVRTHYSSKNVLELFDIIKTSSYAKDCHIDVILLNQTLPLK